MSLSNLKTFIYEPLNGERDFRLVTLHQGTGQDPISLTISRSALDRTPTYEALSYVWGPQNPSQTVQCNDSALEIGENLGAALRCLRKPDTSRVLWIDRVAINQGDVEERTRQAGLMADIYSFAAAVAVWLGPADPFTESAFAFFDDISAQMQKLSKHQDFSEYAKARAEGHAHAIGYPPLEDSVWAAVRSLLQRPWFSRAWTFQEIILARQAHIYCGAHTYNWQRIETFLTCLRTYPPGPNVEDSRRIGEEKLLDIYKARSMLQQPHLFSQEDKENFLSLFPLLDSMRTRNATDPRDKVFALLNIACDVHDADLKADYGKSHAEVYAITAKWLLRKTKSLAFLSLVEKKDKPDLISWVPDFRYKDNMNFLHQPAQIWRGSNRIYNASGTSKPRVEKEESLFQLTVQGIYVGTIVEQTEPPGNMLNNIALGARVLDGGEWQTFAESCAVGGAYPPTGESIDLAYRRLRIWDRLPGEPLARRQRQSLPTLMDLPKPPHLVQRGTRRHFRPKSGYFNVHPTRYEPEEVVQDGHWIYGPCPQKLSSWRSGGSFFGFGGESYVHGVMDGEILALAMGDDGEGLGWIDELGEEPWPFKTEVLTLV